jgi:hypothetical protein
MKGQAETRTPCWSTDLMPQLQLFPNLTNTTSFYKSDIIYALIRVSGIAYKQVREVCIYVADSEQRLAII